MTETRPPLASFDGETLGAVAREFGLGEDRLSDIVRSHQLGVRDLPGVDDIVYEWRNHFHMDPLVERTEEVYVLALEEHVWDEFGDRLELTDQERSALEAVHDRQARRLASATDRFEGKSGLVLTRP